MAYWLGIPALALLFFTAGWWGPGSPGVLVGTFLLFSGWLGWAIAQADEPPPALAVDNASALATLRRLFEEIVGEAPYLQPFTEAGVAKVRVTHPRMTRDGWRQIADRLEALPAFDGEPR